MMKGKKYDWKDSNMALFGTETDRQVKKESAETEPAWQGAGQDCGVKVWRIEQFEVKDWPTEDYGKFYAGDSYIILNTYQNDGEDELQYDVHFWIGKESSQDEYGTAAYKTVELDTLLDDKPIQHREVQGRESKLFKSYFPVMTTMRGGVKSGFRHVEPVEYKPRLLQLTRQHRTVNVSEKPLNRSCIHDGDVFILDLGTKLYQWNGPEANKDERFKAAQYLQQIEGERGGVESEVLEGGELDEGHEFYLKLDGEMDDDDDEYDGGDGVVRLYKICNSDFDQVKEGGVTRDDLQSDDVFLVDAGYQVFVWVGSGASREEIRNGIPYAHKYTCSKDPTVPVTILKEGQACADFDTVMAG